jgi:adenine-specific DNA-methyltransferase
MYWRVSKENFQKLDLDKRIWWGEDGNNMPRLKRFLSEVKQGRTPQTIWFYKEVGHTQDAKKALLKYVPFQHTENVLNSVKPVELLQRVLQLAGQPGDGDIVLDFFSGSATTAHAVLQQNAEDGGNRRYIAVQLAEPLPTPEAGMTSIFEMGLTRVRNVATELRTRPGGEKLDVGFRVLKVDTSNMKDVFYRPDELEQNSLLQTVENVKQDRTAEDLLFQVLADWGVDLALPLRREIMQGKTVFFVNEQPYDLIACFDAGVTEDLVKELARHEPLRIVFRDNGFVSDALKINVEQIFRQLSPSTDVKSI